MQRGRAVEREVDRLAVGVVCQHVFLGPVVHGRRPSAGDDLLSENRQKERKQKQKTETETGSATKTEPETEAEILLLLFVCFPPISITPAPISPEPLARAFGPKLQHVHSTDRTAPQSNPWEAAA